jgi:hypothetical protein
MKHAERRETERWARIRRENLYRGVRRGSRSELRPIIKAKRARRWREHMEDLARDAQDDGYDAFMADCLKACRCDDSYRPCASVMTGGLCDDMQTGDGPEPFDYGADDDDQEDDYDSEGFPNP